jgi:hypothetical protein
LPSLDGGRRAFHRDRSAGGAAPRPASAPRGSLRTFDNRSGRNVFYRAAIHPAAAPLLMRLIAQVAERPSVAIYDPAGYFADLAAMYDLSDWSISGLYVQRLEEVGQNRAGFDARPLTRLAEDAASLLLVADFDGERQLSRLGPCRPMGAATASFDAARLGPEWLTAPDHYLDPLNFVSDFVLFRDQGGLHTVVSTINYWHRHGAGRTRLWLSLLDADGAELAAWDEPLDPAPVSVVIDSRTVRRRFGLGEFAGSLFIHAIGTAAHDTMKYAVDVFDDEGETTSVTHDSNPWPADFYAGLPAAGAGEQVRLWVQNCYPTPIPPGSIGIRPMGDGPFASVASAIPPYGTMAIDPARLVPATGSPTQFEIRADKHFCRPRYEVRDAAGRRSIAHANVERTDLQPAADLAEATRLLGKGFILPGPLLPIEEWSTLALPTPMATGQTHLTLLLRAYDPEGGLIAEKPLGRRRRDEQSAIVLDEFLADAPRPPSGYGHLEFGYDFANGAEGDGWLHAIFRYQRRVSGHSAETSFGSHMFNVPSTWRNEPNSYLGKPPGLSTRLFLRLPRRAGRVLCHLIYPTSGTWLPFSETDIILHDRKGDEIARRRIAVPCSGSRLLDIGAIFGEPERITAIGGYIIVRDTVCRLFGYHLFLSPAGGFALDHMFGF